MFERLERSEKDCIALRIGDTLTDADLSRLRPYLEEKTDTHGSLFVLLQMDDWRGWESISALWDDLGVTLRVNENVQRLAMVGDAEWERWAAKLSKPFAHGEVRYFDSSQLDEAWAWVCEKSTASRD